MDGGSVLAWRCVAAYKSLEKIWTGMVHYRTPASHALWHVVPNSLPPRQAAAGGFAEPFLNKQVSASPERLQATELTFSNYILNSHVKAQ